MMQDQVVFLVSYCKTQPIGDGKEEGKCGNTCQGMDMLELQWQALLRGCPRDISLTPMARDCGQCRKGVDTTVMHLDTDD